MKILVVDDNKDSRMILKKTFEYDGYTVEVASDGADALKIARESIPDLIISDILMPTMDGFSLCREIKGDKLLKGIPFVFYTATYGDPQDEKLGMNSGASRYILKPADNTTLLRIIKDLLIKHENESTPEIPVKKKQELFRMHEDSLTRKLQEKVQALQLYRKIFTSSKDAITIFNTEGFYIEQNSFNRLLLGYSDEELREKTPAIHLGKKVFSKMLRELSEKGIYRRELISHTKSASVINIEFSAFPILGENNEVVCYVGIKRDITERKCVEKSLQNALNEVEYLKNRFQAENVYLQNEIKIEHNFDEIISRGNGLKKVLHKVEQVALTNTTVLILGESGTGKELVARAVHSTSNRHERPLVKVNCAALPENLIESELFGHKKGAFTGAFSDRIGRFELASGGTIFLDEIGELPLELQAKLLRVLQWGEFERVGSPHTIKVDVRVIASTNRELEKAVKMGEFREDLYYRLNVFPIKVLPLRERKEDIPLLAKHFIRKYSIRIGKNIESVPDKIIEALKSYDWPGNVRELENVIERNIILTCGPVFELDEQFVGSPSLLFKQSDEIPTLKEIEKDLICRALEESYGVIGGKRGAAVRLDIPPTTLRERIKKYGIEKPSSKSH